MICSVFSLPRRSAGTALLFAVECETEPWIEFGTKSAVPAFRAVVRIGAEQTLLFFRVGEDDPFMKRIIHIAAIRSAEPYAEQIRTGVKGTGQRDAVRLRSGKFVFKTDLFVFAVPFDQTGGERCGAEERSPCLISCIESDPAEKRSERAVRLADRDRQLPRIIQPVIPPLIDLCIRCGAEQNGCQQKEHLEFHNVSFSLSGRNSRGRRRASWNNGGIPYDRQGNRRWLHLRGAGRNSAELRLPMRHFLPDRTKYCLWYRRSACVWKLL